MSRTDASRSGTSLLDESEALAAPGKSKATTSSSESFLSGKVFAGLGAALLSLGVLAYVVWSSYNSVANTAIRSAFLTTMKDSETGEVFKQIDIRQERSIPFSNPKTGKRTLFPAEECYWTKDGKAKLEPDYVILNERMGKPGRTTCHVCGRTVTRGNAMPPDALMQQAWDAAQSANKR